MTTSQRTSLWMLALGRSPGTPPTHIAQDIAPRRHHTTLPRSGESAPLNPPPPRQPEPPFSHQEAPTNGHRSGELSIPGSGRPAVSIDPHPNKGQAMPFSPNKMINVLQAKRKTNESKTPKASGKDPVATLHQDRSLPAAPKSKCSEIYTNSPGTQ